MTVVKQGMSKRFFQQQRETKKLTCPGWMCRGDGVGDEDSGAGSADDEAAYQNVLMFKRAKKKKGKP